MHFSPAEQPRVLIVEDEMLVAMELAEMVSDAGYEPVGPVSSVPMALKVVADEPLDAAVLDYRLDGETTVAVWEALEGKRVPFAIASAFTGDQLPASYRERPHLDKPLVEEQVFAILAILMPAL
jgi:CheY-like chemotaxis protein